MTSVGLSTTSGQPQLDTTDPNTPTWILSNSCLINLLYEYREADPDDLYDLSTVPHPTENGNIFFNTENNKEVRPNAPTLHGNSAALVAAVICTEAEPIILPRNDHLEPCESLISIVHVFFNHLDEKESDNKNITIVMMDVSYSLRLVFVGHKEHSSKIVM